MADDQSAADKSFDPTPKKLEDARKKGEIPRSVDLQTAAGYAGLTLALLAAGAGIVHEAGTQMMTLLDQADALADLMFAGDAYYAPMGGILFSVALALVPLFAAPAVGVALAIAVQRAFTVTPSKLQPKLSRISIIKNAGNKFGRNGLFEFFKSFVKLVIYSIALAIFLRARMPEIVAVLNAEVGIGLALLGELTLQFLFIVVLVSVAIGGIDAIWQYQEHIRKNRMSRKEIQDETKDAEGDPHMKQERRARAQVIAATQMMAKVPDADVVVVNPTHYAVALKWSRKPGSAPECVAKGVDEVARKIREIAEAEAVPIHHDPPTARALHASTEIGREIAPDHYFAVAAAIRFADEIREKARRSI